MCLPSSIISTRTLRSAVWNVSYSHWSTRHADGFREADLHALRRLVPPLALAVKCASLAASRERWWRSILAETLGAVSSADASRAASRTGSRPCSGFPICAAIRHITDAASPDEIIPLLNDYADAAISSIQDAGGDVLKLIGDGVLAIFNTDDPGQACAEALRAEADLRSRLSRLNARRAGEGRPITSVYLGLHIGEVFYGNIGSENRLDFTVVGPAVNEVSRIASMCRSVDRKTVLSAEFATAARPDDRARLVSVGRYALRGVGRAKELFTLDPTTH